jgi:hypothetical protein
VRLLLSRVRRRGRLKGGMGNRSLASPIERSTHRLNNLLAAVKVHEAKPGREAYRVFQQGATGFVSIQSVRDDAEQRANDFCKRKTGGVMESMQETTANPPFILGNFSRIEIVFDCVPNVESAAAAGDDPEYTKLVKLKKLLDDGVITQAEFDTEKAKILSQQ